MKFRSRTPNVDPPVGATRILLRFAWLPTLVNGYWLWLENYEILQGFVEIPYNLLVDKKSALFAVKSWVNISKRGVNEGSE